MAETVIRAALHQPPQEEASPATEEPAPAFSVSQSDVDDFFAALKALDVDLSSF